MIHDHFDFFKNVFEPETPLAKLFESENSYYLYDTGTNKILECRKELFLLLSRLMGSTCVEETIEEYIGQYGEEEFRSAAKRSKKPSNYRGLKNSR